MTKIGRNQPCPCGSGKKFKKCCGGISKSSDKRPLGPTEVDIKHIIEKHRAAERIREDQQGLGRPIISQKIQDQQLVAVGNRLYYSPKWKTFPDFLGDYIKQILGAEWGNAEIAKSFNERHPILQWYEVFCSYQKGSIKTPGEVHSAALNGIVACYLGLAYSLYLLNHNVELQNRLVHRLKNPSTFQGAYYELIVANTLIRAGFTLTLEDETDGASKHCEFAAVSKLTGKKYWVEAKMRGVVGILGKTVQDGTSDQNPISHLIPHLNNALQKPAANERLIFIDLNAEAMFEDDGKPDWSAKAIKRLEQYEAKELTGGIQAYVFVTNLPFHRMLNETLLISALPFGLGMPDFNRPGYFRLSDIYRQKQKHIDAHHIGEALQNYPCLPTTFDGRLPSEAFGQSSSRVIIGETNTVKDGVIGTVTTAAVSEPEKQVYIGDSRGRIFCQPISDEELADYRAHPEAYFGMIQSVPKTAKSRYEFFEWLMEAFKGLSREILLERLAAAPNFECLKNMADADLLAEYCERMVAASEAKDFRVKG